MFPTIFALGVVRLGVNTKTGAAYLIMSIVGGAIVPYFAGLIADARSTAPSCGYPRCASPSSRALVWNLRGKDTRPNRRHQQSVLRQSS